MPGRAGSGASPLSVWPVVGGLGGIALTHDEKELWLADCHNSAIHIFDNAVMPPKQTTSLKMRDCVGWITMSLDGRYVYSSTGEVIDVNTKKIVAALTDEARRQVQSEKVLDVYIANGTFARAHPDLVARFQDPAAGSISLNGVDLREMRLASSAVPSRFSR